MQAKKKNKTGIKGGKRVIYQKDLVNDEDDNDANDDINNANIDEDNIDRERENRGKEKVLQRGRERENQQKPTDN